MWVGVAALALLFSVTFYNPVWTAYDPDDLLRHVQVQAWLSGQSWFDLTQHRINPPSGVPMHWSRWIDLPLALTTLVGMPFLGMDTAQSVAEFIVPLITLGLAALLVYIISRRLFDEHSARVASILLLISPAPLLEMHPGRIDHHGWQIVLALSAGVALISKFKKSGIFIGLCLALSLAISIEGLPLTLIFLCPLAVEWIYFPTAERRLTDALNALASGSILLWISSHHLHDLRIFDLCDVVGPSHLLAFACGALIITMGSSLFTWSALLRTSTLITAAIITVTAFLIASPRCAGNPFAQLDPLVYRNWYLRVDEGLPIHLVWSRNPGLVWVFYGQALVSAGATIVILCRDLRLTGKLRMDRSYFAVVVVGSTLVSLFVMRAAATSTALALPFLGQMVREWVDMAAFERNVVKKLLKSSVIIFSICPWIFSLRLNNDYNILSNHRCNITQAAGFLSEVPPGIILAPLDLGPQLLLKSKHSIVASGHHRGALAMKDTMLAFQGSEIEAENIIFRHSVNYIAVCRYQNEPSQYTSNSPTGFLSKILNGKEPRWLHPITLNKPRNFYFWKVDQESLRATVSGTPVSNLQGLHAS